MKKPDKPETDYEHMVMVSITVFAAAILTVTLMILVIRLYE